MYIVNYRILPVLIINLFFISTMQAQIENITFTGEYSLRGVPEMASGFKFNSDGTFQFFYIYGASDRQANGTFIIEDNKLILSGTKTPGKDFRLIEKKNSGIGTTVKISGSNELLLKNVVCYFLNGKDTGIQETDDQGIARSDLSGCNKIQLIHSYFPDVPTSFEIDIEKNNYYEFTLENSLSEVVFDKYIIEMDSDPEILYCGNIYLFPKEKVKFVRTKKI